MAVAAVASFGAWFTPGSWYEALAKPSWNPPNWLFGPVWSVLYVMIAISGWLIWSQRARVAIGFALSLFAFQLVLNALWSALFFGLHRIDWAAIEICVLWAMIGFLIRISWKISRPAAYLLLPYWLWVSFAAFLNLTVWQLNRIA